LGGAGRWIAVCDGGSGLEDLLQLRFGRLDAVILDFYDANEHLGDFAKARHPGDAAAAEAMHAVWSRLRRVRGAGIRWHFGRERLAT
jgi:hypothetical protein